MPARTTKRDVERGGPLAPRGGGEVLSTPALPPAPQPPPDQPAIPPPVLPPTVGPPIGPQGPPAPSPQPTAPSAPRTQPTTPGAASFGREGLAPGAEISAPPTFAQTGGKEAWRRGFTGALFSPESIFSSGGRGMGPPGLSLGRGAQVPTAMGGGGGLTLTPSPTPGGVGVPFDGGLGAGPGWPGVTDPVQQMIMSGMMRQ